MESSTLVLKLRLSGSSGTGFKSAYFALTLWVQATKEVVNAGEQQKRETADGWGGSELKTGIFFVDSERIIHSCPSATLYLSWCGATSKTALFIITADINEHCIMTVLKLGSWIDCVCVCESACAVCFWVWVFAMVKANLKKVISYAIHEKYQQYVNLIYKLTLTYLQKKKKASTIPTHTFILYTHIHTIYTLKMVYMVYFNRKHYWRCVCIEIGCALCCSVSFITCLLLFL